MPSASAPLLLRRRGASRFRRGSGALLAARQLAHAVLLRQMRRVRAEREIQRIADVDLRVAIGNLLQRMELSAGQRDPRGAVQHDHGGIGLAVEATGIRRSEEHTSELQSLMRTSYAVFCLKKKKNTHTQKQRHH